MSHVPTELRTVHIEQGDGQPPVIERQFRLRHDLTNSFYASRFQHQIASSMSAMVYRNMEHQGDVVEAIMGLTLLE